MIKKGLRYGLLLLVIPAILLTGALLFRDKQYAWMSLGIAVAACIPFFLTFEKGKAGTRQMIAVAVMIAIAVVGRLIFAPLPGFKPVTAIVVIAALYLGGEAGFVTGALAALVSNFFFGQGPWTPFQMFTWGLIGLAAGLLAAPLKKHLVLLLIYGAAAGVFFSLLMDVWTTLWYDGAFNLTRYLAAVVTAGPFTLEYGISNVIFLLVLAKPVGGKLERIKTKYGL
ncbi:MAG: ECF transporter S component [Clostridiales bacterium]|jgi:energy-coupling factor transport system substrate-specific component|nr:ECF transporter S component [Clostridiales bacterium]